VHRWPAVVAFVLSATCARAASADEPPTPESPPPADETNKPAEETTPASPPAGNPWLPQPEKARPTDHWSAKPAPKEAPKSSKKPTRWYGWQTLLVDAAALGLMIGAFVDANERARIEGSEAAGAFLVPTRLLDEPPKTTAFIDASLAFYTLAPAFVHAVHERGVQAALSPPIRLFAPTAGTFVGAVYGLGAALVVAVLDDRSNGLDSDDPAGKVLIGSIVSGYILGFVAPILIDAIAFGHEPIESDDADADKKKAARNAPKVKWMPRLGWSPKDGPSFGVGASF
jgi:hypothetical protein